MDVSVVIPTYNEEENIADLIDAIFSELDREVEVIVVDGDSEDSTPQKVREAGEDRPVELVEKSSREGIGAAYQEGFRHASGDVVVQMDADFSHPVESLPEMVEEVESGTDIAVGSRYVKGGDRQDPLHRRIFPLIGSYLYTYLLDCPVRDFTSGFKAYREDVAKDIPEMDLPAGFHYQAASLMNLLDTGRSFREVPIEFRPRRAGEPKYSTMDLLNNVKLFVKLLLRRRSDFLKFGVVGASGVLVNMGVLYFLTEQLGIYYLYSAVLAIEMAILSNFTWNELWTFSERGEGGIRSLGERLLKFNSVSLIGAGMNLALLWFFTEVLGVLYLVSNLAAIMMVFLWNYVANVRWTWKE